MKFENKKISSDLKTFTVFIALALSISPVLKARISSVKAEPKEESSVSAATASPAAKPFRIVANSFSQKFHLPQCEFARKMNLKHVRLLHDKAEAARLNYKACNWCFPRWDKSVSSKIIDSQAGQFDAKEKKNKAP